MFLMNRFFLLLCKFPYPYTTNLKKF